MKVHEIVIFLNKDEELHTHINATESSDQWPAILRINTSSSATDEATVIFFLSIDQLLKFNKTLTVACLSIPIEKMENKENVNE